MISPFIWEGDGFLKKIIILLKCFLLANTFHNMTSFWEKKITFNIISGPNQKVNIFFLISSFGDFLQLFSFI